MLYEPCETSFLIEWSKNLNMQKIQTLWNAFLWWTYTEKLQEKLPCKNKYWVSNDFYSAIVFLRKISKLVVECFRSFPMKSGRIHRHAMYALRTNSWSPLLLGGPRGPVWHLRHHRPNFIAQQLYIMRSYRHTILHVESIDLYKHWIANGYRWGCPSLNGAIADSHSPCMRSSIFTLASTQWQKTVISVLC